MIAPNHSEKWLAQHEKPQTIMELSVTPNTESVITFCCFKLEIVLKDLLAQFGVRVKSPDLILGYLCKYGYDGRDGKVFTELREGQYTKCLKSRTKMTFENLVYEVFDNTNPEGEEKQEGDKQMGTPAEYLRVANEKEHFAAFNDMHTDLLHHSEETTMPNLYDIYSKYVHIIKNSQTFRQAYPADDIEAVSCDLIYLIKHKSVAFHTLAFCPWYSDQIPLQDIQIVQSSCSTFCTNHSPINC